MNCLSLLHAAADARGADAARPATAIVHDAPDARLVVFRIAAGQAVSPHRSESTVMLVVLSGRGIVSGGDGERVVAQGDLLTYDPSELHGMRATAEELTLVAIIAPRPGSQRARASTQGAP